MKVPFFLALVGLPGLGVGLVDPGTLYYQHSSGPSLLYDFPAPNHNGSAAFPMQKCQGHQLEESSIDDLQALLHSKNLSSVELVFCYLERIYQTGNYLKYDDASVNQVGLI